MSLVDNRDTAEHSVRAIAGTLSYTSGEIVKCLLPVVVWNLTLLAAGAVMTQAGVTAGRWLLASGVASFLSCASQKPDIQLYGEPINMGLMWAAVASCGVSI